MDDIAFFDSSSYSHRGGIWPDAGRREKPNVSNVHSAVHDDLSTVSAPPDVDSSSLISGDVDSDVKRSSSEGDVNITTGLLPMSPQESHRSATLPPSRGPSPIPGPSHHHSLFHPREHHPPAEDPDLSTEAVLLEVQHPHLRHKASSSSEKSKRRFLGIRRTSPSPPSGVGSRSRSHEPSPTPSLENLRTASPEPPNSAIPPSHPRPTKSPTPSSQSSLLSTLKSRAGDRQALSNTAKETMRKWTVNWGGLKKDRDSSVASSANVQDGQDSKPRSTSHTMKSSYAEIRAAVDGRKEKERGSSEGPSTPISIPDGGHRERTGSVSSMNNPHGSSLSSSSQESSMAPPSSAGWSVDPWVDETSSELASQPPPAIDVDGTPLESEDVNGEGPAPATTTLTPTLPQRPIQSQPPQGKTMTIPGIHARNRGEVMSMGYVPPSPPAPEAKTGVSSVYRLWKHSPVSPSEQLDGDADAEHAGLHSPPVLTADSALTSGEPTPTDITRPHAPPLPPRTPTPLHSIPSDSSRLSSASAALKTIASRDEESRTQDGEGVEASSSPAPASPKPPLPPRKIHAPA
jgi:hypothetical protein